MHLLSQRLTLVLVATWAVAGGCSGDSHPESSELRLAMFASAEGLPPWTFNDILFVDHDTICAPETYRYRIVCGDDRLVAELEVRHRLLGFDIWEDRLVVLVERPHQDDQGLYVRGLDYYRIHGR